MGSAYSGQSARRFPNEALGPHTADPSVMRRGQHCTGMLSFEVLQLLGVQAVTYGGQLQAISEGLELEPKVYHEDVSNAMTLPTKHEEIIKVPTVSAVSCILRLFFHAGG